MAGKSTRLRQDYTDGFEIVTLDGGHPVMYVPRSYKDKAPWARVVSVEGVHFRHCAAELKSVHTRATTAFVTSGRKAADDATNRLDSWARMVRG